MDSGINSIKNSSLSSISAHASKNVLNAIELASNKSGVDFSYLVQQAAAESNFNPSIKAKTSSATGLYQFIDSTWLQTVKRYGEEYGLNVQGKSRSEILDMRKDPKAASFMAAAFASENEKTLNENWGGKVGATELYFAHFLGAGGASSFLKARDENPLQTAADLFPQAARANRNVFYDPQTGKARTLEQVYQFFDKKFQAKGTASETLIAQDETRSPSRKSYGSVPVSLSKGIIMQKAQAMRDAAAAGQSNPFSDIGFLASQNAPSSLLTKAQKPIHNMHTTQDNMPFFSMLSRPVDLMIMTQTVPGKVIRDKS